MSLGASELVVKRVTAYSPRVAAGLGRLMPILDEGFSGDPMPRKALEEIIESPSHDQLVAEHRGQIVGSGVMTLILGSGFWRDKPEGQQQNRQGHLEDFVVDPSMRGVRDPGTGKSAADLIWDGMQDFCRDHDAPALVFDSETWRPDAWKFYAKHGAGPLPDTRHFEVPVPDVGANI
ncbi:MAG TPA: GNAT family N-acetyltransferase [Candidatus Saccharimonadales bacterium]|jgi:ribosomal protein S18 acetylase RimI-like enzyme